MKVLDGFSLGDNLVDEISPQNLREKLSSDPCKRERMKLFNGNPLEDLFQYPLNGWERLSFDPGIMFLQHFPMIIQDDGIGTDRTDIDA